MAFSRIGKILLLVTFISAGYIAWSFTPPTKEEHVESFNNVNEYVEPFRRNLTQCARQVKASMVDVENFLKKIPQSTMQGKCFVACILKRNAIIKNNKIDKKALVDSNKAIYGEESEVVIRITAAVDDCTRVVKDVFEICEFASMFNDCMHIKTEHLLDEVMMQQRLKALGDMTSDPEAWSEHDDEILRLVKDEL